MAEPHGKPQDGEHIDELLSQLKGIFGHLSESEKEEARQKIVPPAVPVEPRREPDPPSSVPIPAPPSEIVLPEPQAPPPESLTPGMPLETPAAAMEAQQTEPQAALDPWVPPAEPAPLAPETQPVPAAGNALYTPTTPTIPAGAFLFPAAIFYPAGRIHDAKIAAEKIERMTPKFTKVTFVLNIQALTVYDPKADIKNAILTQTGVAMKAVFILVDKSLDEARRKAISLELEPRGVYFQEIPSNQIEKKALYTDMLLGLVFFFDSQKPSTEPAP